MWKKLMSFFYLGPATRNTCLYPEFLLRPGFSVEYCDKKLKAKKTYTRGKNSITQGSYQGFHQKICNVPTALLHNSCPMIGFYLNAQNEFLFEMKKGLKCPSLFGQLDGFRMEELFFQKCRINSQLKQKNLKVSTKVKNLVCWNDVQWKSLPWTLFKTTKNVLQSTSKSFFPPEVLCI